MTVTAERYGRAYAASISQWATTLSGLLPSACGLREVQSLNLQYRHCLWTKQVPVTVSSRKGSLSDELTCTLPAHQAHISSTAPLRRPC